jgi:Ni,Fe-hydrogenase maturation factor
MPAILRATLSAHEASLCDLLAALTLLGRSPHAFVAIGIEPQTLAPSVELSAPVREALANAEHEVIPAVDRLGHFLQGTRRRTAGRPHVLIDHR